MATETQRSQLRADTGTDTTSLPNDDADAIYTLAAASYTDTASADAYARVIAFRRLLAQAAARTSYQQNQSREDLSDLFKHYQAMVAHWQNELETAIGLAGGAARWGGMRRKPTRLKELPDA